MRTAVTVFVLSALANAAPPNASVNAMLAYPLTSANLDQYEKASRAMTALIARDATVLAKLKPSPTGAPNSIDETVAFTQKQCPACVTAVTGSGMSYRDYVVFQGSLMIAYISALRPRPNSQVHVTPANLQFVKANRARIEQILAEQRQHPSAPKN